MKEVLGEEIRAFKLATERLVASGSKQPSRHYWLQNTQEAAPVIKSNIQLKKKKTKHKLAQLFSCLQALVNTQINGSALPHIHSNNWLKEHYLCNSFLETTF